MSFTVVKLLDRLNPTIITGGFVPRGTYDNATDYAVGDSVDYNGSSYVMFSNASAGTLPTDTDYWQVVANGGVSSVNTKSGIVVIDPDDLNDTSTTNKFTTAGDISKLAGIEALADVTDTTNVTAAGALMDSELTSLSGVKTLTLPDSTTISTFGATLTDDTDAATARTTLGLTAGGAGDIWVEKAGDTMTGDLIFSGSQKIIGGSGTTSDLTLQTTSGVGTTGADMHFLVGNNGVTEAMTILNSGNVGIGTTSPTTALTTVISSGSSAINTMLGQNNDANGVGALAMQNNSTGVVRFGIGGTTNGPYPSTGFISSTGGLSLALNGAGTATHVFTASGNVGIGTANPGQKLEVNGSILLNTNNAQVSIRDNSGAYIPTLTLEGGSGSMQGNFSSSSTTMATSLYGGTGYSLRLGANGSDSNLIINTSGKVGIGTTQSTGDELTIEGSSSTASYMHLFTTGGGSIASPAISGIKFSSSDLGYRVSSIESLSRSADTVAGILRFNVASNITTGTIEERLRIDGATGNVGIGTTSPSYTLHVASGSNIAGLITSLSSAETQFQIANTSTGGRIWSLVSGGQTAISGVPTGYFGIRDGTSGSNRLVIDTSGNVGIGTVSPVGKLMIDGSADDQQLIVQAHSTQTTNILEIQNSSAAALMSVSGTGKLGIGTAATYILDVLAPAADTYATYITQGKQLMLLGIENSTAASVSNTVGFEFRLKSTTQTRSAFRFDGGFTTTTDASRTSYVGISTSNSGAFAENFRLEGTKATLTGEIQIGGNLNHDGTNIGFFGVTPTTRQTELTDELTTVTFTAPGTPDYAIQALVNVSGYGFATQDEGHTLLSVVANLQTRVNELETKLVAYGLLIDAD